MSPKTFVSPCTATTIGWQLNKRMHSRERISRSAATIDGFVPKSFLECMPKNLVMAWIPDTGKDASKHRLCAREIIAFAIANASELLSTSFPRQLCSATGT